MVGTGAPLRQRLMINACFIAEISCIFKRLSVNIAIADYYYYYHH